MSDFPPVIGFDGNASITPELVSANLLHDLPDEVILVIPAGIAADSSLGAVLSWLYGEYEESDIHVATDFMETMEDYLAKGHETSLILLLDREHDYDMSLWGWAARNGIPVRDLAQNLITLGDPPRDDEEPPVIAPTTRPVKAILGDITAGVENIKELLAELDGTPQFSGGIMKGAPGFSGPRIAQDIASQPQEPDAAPPLPADTVPRFKYVQGPDNRYTPRRRGRLARGYTQVMLTGAEVENLRAQGQLTD